MTIDHPWSRMNRDVDFDHGCPRLPWLMHIPQVVTTCHGRRQLDIADVYNSWTKSTQHVWWYLEMDDIAHLLRKTHSIMLRNTAAHTIPSMDHGDQPRLWTVAHEIWWKLVDDNNLLRMTMTCPVCWSRAMQHDNWWRTKTSTHGCRLSATTMNRNIWSWMMIANYK